MGCLSGWIVWGEVEGAWRWLGCLWFLVGWLVRATPVDGILIYQTDKSVLEAETGRYLREDDRSLESNPLTTKSGGCPLSLGEQFQGVGGRGSLMRVSLGKMRRNFREQGPLLKRFTVKDDQWGLYPDEDKCGGFHCV